MFVSFFAALSGLGILFYWRYGKPENPKKTLKNGGLLFGQAFLVWIIGFGAAAIVQSNAREELKLILKNDELQLSINNEYLNEESQNEIISILKTIQNMPPHHSSPRTELQIQISNKEEITNIFLSEDSMVKNEYWIFWDKYYITRLNEIGRITDEKIKKYGS
jgi:hypothetical protein